MPIAFVQKAPDIVAAGGGSVSTTLTVTAGSLLVVTFENTSADAELTSVTDNRGNTWTKDRTRTSVAAGRRVSIYSAPNCAGGSTTVTTNYPGGGAYRAQVTEFSGVATSAYVDVSGENTSDGDTSTPSPGLSIADGSVAVMCVSVDRTTNPTAGTGYTGLQSSASTLSAYKIFTGAGSGERGAFNSAPSQYDAVIVAYKAVPPPAGFGAGATLGGVLASGSLASIMSGFSSGAALGAVVAGGSLGQTPGTFLLGPIIVNGVPQAGAALDWVRIYSDAGILLYERTGGTLNGAGSTTLTTNAAPPGTPVRIDWQLSSGRRRMPRVTMG